MSEQTEGPSKKREEWLKLVGVILVLSSPLILVVSGGQLPKLAATSGLVGLALILLPEYLRLRLWPFLAPYLASGIVGIVIAPSEPGVICIIVTLLMLLLSLGFRWWKTRPVKRV